MANTVHCRKHDQDYPQDGFCPYCGNAGTATKETAKQEDTGTTRLQEIKPGRRAS